MDAKPSLPLETERLRLRLPTVEDAPFFLELLNDPDWHRFVNDPGVRDISAAADWIESRLLKAYREHGFTFYMTTMKDTDLPIGICGLIHRPGLDHPDLGFGFLPAYRSQGHAQEAARSCIGLAREAFAIPKLYAITQHDNIASIRLLERLGFHLDGEHDMEGEEQPLARFSISL